MFKYVTKSGRKIRITGIKPDFTKRTITEQQPDHTLNPHYIKTSQYQCNINIISSYPPHWLDDNTEHCDILGNQLISLIMP